MKDSLLSFLFCFFLNTLSGQLVIPHRALLVNDSIVAGAEQPDKYFKWIAGKKVAVVANQTSVVRGAHLVDFLLENNIEVVKVFAPEHGFRGEAGAGETINDGIDAKTKLPLISLYGKNKKPAVEQLKDIDIVVFDIQDVGARFYTYISTMHYVMEACAEQGKQVLVLDRPNPNGFYVDGPMLKEGYKSFVGMHPIPVVHGCTVGELAQMINGEHWLEGGVECELKVVSCTNYKHSDLYNLPVKPSPNLPNMSAVYLYPSLCFFEGTIVSVGRGTELPFQCIGYPGNLTGKFEFVPKNIKGVAENPLHEGEVCSGHNLYSFGEFYFTSSKELYLEWLTGLYGMSAGKSGFFSAPEFFDKLAGSDQLRKQLIAGKNASEIRNEWQSDIKAYKVMRKKYLLYPDFEN